MAPALALQGFSAIFTAMLQIHGRFAGPAAVGVAFNFGIIVGVVVGQGSIGIEAAAWGVVLGATLQVLLQLPQFWRLLREAHARPALTHPRLGAVGLLALPVLGASLLQQINSFTDKLFASSLEAGRVSALSFANALGQAPRVALLLPLLTPLFPLIARLDLRGARGRGPERVPARGRAARPGVDPDDAAAGDLRAARSPSSRSSAASARPDCVDQIGPPLVFYALGLWPAFASLPAQPHAVGRQPAARHPLDDGRHGRRSRSSSTSSCSARWSRPASRWPPRSASTPTRAMLLIGLRAHFPRCRCGRSAAPGRDADRRRACGAATAAAAQPRAADRRSGLARDDRRRSSVKVASALAVYVIAGARALARDELARGRARRAGAGRRAARRPLGCPPMPTSVVTGGAGFLGLAPVRPPARRGPPGDLRRQPRHGHAREHRAHPRRRRSPSSSTT